MKKKSKKTGKNPRMEAGSCLVPEEMRVVPAQEATGSIPALDDAGRGQGPLEGE